MWGKKREKAGQKWYAKEYGWEFSETHERHQFTDLKSPIKPKQGKYKQKHS